MTTLELQILADLFALLSDKEAVLFVDPDARVERYGTEWEGFFEDSSTEVFKSSAGNVWRHMKATIQDSLDRGWVPPHWDTTMGKINARTLLSKALKASIQADTKREATKLVKRYKTSDGLTIGMSAAERSERVNRKARERYAAKKKVATSKTPWLSNPAWPMTA